MGVSVIAQPWSGKRPVFAADAHSACRCCLTFPRKLQDSGLTFLLVPNLGRLVVSLRVVIGVDWERNMQESKAGKAIKGKERKGNARKRKRRARVRFDTVSSNNLKLCSRPGPFLV